MLGGEQDSPRPPISDEAERRNPSEKGTFDKGLRTRLVILGVVVVMAVGYMAYAAFPGKALYFLTVNEFMSKQEYHDGRTLRVSGKLVDGSFHRQERSTLAQFYLADKAGPGAAGEHLQASYDGVLPDLFFNPHSEIILQGHYREDRVFRAETILVKCPSKYRSLEQELSGTSPGT